MKKDHWLLVLPILILSFSRCTQWGGALPEHVIAQVNQDQITIEEFNREFKELILDSHKETGRKTLEDLKQAYLDQVIERKILVQEARRLGISVMPEELNRAILEIKMDYPQDGFGEKLGLKGMTLEEWKSQLEERLLAEKMIQKALGDQGEIPEKEVREYYETHRSSFQTSQKVRARQIVVADGEEAIQILKRLKKGESFEKLATVKSLGPERVNGGDLGYFGQGEKPTEFDCVFTLEVGALSQVIKSPYGYHIFKLEEKLQPRQIPFQEAKATILQDLGRTKGEQAYQKWFKGLRGKAKVKINPKWFSS